jgi:hypothetical protein
MQQLGCGARLTANAGAAVLAASDWRTATPPAALSSNARRVDTTAGCVSTCCVSLDVQLFVFCSV